MTSRKGVALTSVPAQGVPLSVLVVEDDESYLAYVQLMLSQMTTVQCSVSGAGSIREAHDHLDHHAADLILLDLSLPDSRGDDEYSGLRDLAQRTPATPIIVLTGSLFATELDAVRQGAQDLLDKRTITPLLLERSIRHAVERHLQSNRMMLQSEQLRDAIVHLDRFGAMVAHDLKAPLTAVAIALGTLPMVEPDLGPQAMLMIERAARRVETLAEHIDGLLEEVGDATGEADGRAEINVGETIRWIETLLERDLAHVRLESEGLTGFWGEPTLIRQLLMNLVLNAARHNPVGPLRVRVSTRACAGGIRLVVEDSGCGIAALGRDRLFTPGERGETLPSGHGMGLASCRMAVNRHGGRIWIEDSDLGGAAFIAEIPQRNSVRAAA